MKALFWKDVKVFPSGKLTQSVMVHFPEMDITLAGRFTLAELRKIVQDAEDYLKNQESDSEDLG